MSGMAYALAAISVAVSVNGAKCSEFSKSDIDVQLEISLERQGERRTVGEPIVIVATIHNRSQEPCVLCDMYPQVYVVFEVIRIKEGSAEVPRTVFGRDVARIRKNVETLGGGGPGLSGGATYQIRYNLARRFDLSREGQYVVRASVNSQIGTRSGRLVVPLAAKPLSIELVPPRRKRGESQLY